MHFDMADLEQAVKNRFFSNFQEEQELVDEVLSSNSLKRFKLAVKKYGLIKISDACILPLPPRTDAKRLYKSLSAVFDGDFI